MSLLFKHLARSIRKKPLQPIILVLTLALSVATAIFAFTINDMMDDDTEVAQAVKYGNAEILIRVGNSSDSRFLFVDDVVDVLGKSAKVAGCYELPLILNGTGDTTVAMATEFDRISDVFDIEFLEYGKVTAGSVCDVAFISANFAEEKGLCVGDTLTVETMGYYKTYRIEGISKHQFLASYDVMVDIGSVVRAFAENSLLFAAIGEDFKPCSQIYVSVDECEGMDSEIAVSLLKADARFWGKSFETVSDIEIRQNNMVMLDVIVDFSVVLAALLSAVIVFCCFYILANERAEENLTLRYSGVAPRLLGMMQYAEVILYWMLGVPLGILAAIPITKMIAVFVDLRYTEVSIHISAIMKSALIILGICLLTTTLFVSVGKRMKRRGSTRGTVQSRWILCLLAVIAALFVLLYLMPANTRLALSFVMIAALVLLIFWATPMLLCFVASAIDKRMKYAQGTLAISFRYALKNICSLKLLHNIARLCALIVAIVLMVALVFACGNGVKSVWHETFDADYIVYNATDACYQKTLSCEQVESVCRSYLKQSGFGMVLSAEDLSVYGDNLEISQLPQGNQVVISIGLAHQFDLDVGDTLMIELDGTPYELVVVEIVRVGINYLIINCEDLGVPYNMLLVKGVEGVSSSALLAELSQNTASELAPIVSVDMLLNQRIRSMDTYMNAGEILLGVLIIFSLIGMVDTFYESLRARREEFELYRLAGMNRKRLRLMKFSELTVTIAVGTLVGVIVFVISAFSLNRGMSGLGAELFLGLKLLFC